MKAIARILQDKSHDESFNQLVATGQAKVHIGLYATTSDFKIGDQAVMIEIEDGIPRMFWKEEIVTAEDIIAFKKQGIYWFKILGKISSNATWVKEGEEIEVKAIDSEIDIHPIHMGLVDKYTYGVKCPTCKSYH